MTRVVRMLLPSVICFDTANQPVYFGSEGGKETDNGLSMYYICVCVYMYSIMYT